MKIFGFPLCAITALAMGAVAFLEPTSGFSQTAAKPEAAVQSSPKVSRQQHGDWMLECYDPAVNGMSCQIQQRVVHNESGQTIMQMTLSHNPKDNADIVQYVLPLDFLLAPGVGVNVGDYQAVARVTRCTAQGCIIEGKTEDAFIKAMKAATEQGRFIMMSRAGKKVGINFSATGFTKAYNEMKEQNTK